MAELHLINTQSISCVPNYVSNQGGQKRCQYAKQLKDSLSNLLHWAQWKANSFI